MRAFHVIVSSCAALLFAVPAAASEQARSGQARSATRDEVRTGSEAWTQAKLESVAAEVCRTIEELRGKKFKARVALRLVDHPMLAHSYSEYLGHILATEEQVADEMTAKLLGMVPGDMDLAGTIAEILRDPVPGFYDADSDTFLLENTASGATARLVMAHELTRALDDQYHDFDDSRAKLAGNTDARMAHYAVVYGSGMALMSEWMARSDLPQSDLVEAQSLLMRSAILGAPPFVWRPFLAISSRGESFLRRTNALNLAADAPRPADIEHAFEEVPRSTEQILHPVKYWKPERADEPRAIACSTDGLPAGWRVLREDTLGELYMGVMTLPFEERDTLEQLTPFDLLGMHYTTDAAEGWGGDRFVLVAKRTGYLLVLDSVWDTPEDALEFGATLRSLAPRVAAEMDRAPGAVAGRSGFRVEPGPAADEVRVISWLGLSPEDVESALPHVAFAE